MLPKTWSPGSLGPHIENALEHAALDLMRFVPPSRHVEPSFFTVEGDPLIDGRATRAITDAGGALELLDSPPQLA
jgi:hypothetical protein